VHTYTRGMHSLPLILTGMVPATDTRFSEVPFGCTRGNKSHKKEGRKGGGGEREKEREGVQYLQCQGWTSKKCTSSLCAVYEASVSYIHFHSMYNHCALDVQYFKPFQPKAGLPSGRGGEIQKA